MSRYIKDFTVEQPIDIVSMMVDDFVYHNQFRRTDWNGEMVYSSTDKYGTDRFFKWSYAGGVFHIEAWIKGLGGKEADLSGAYKAASRSEYAAEIEKLKNKIGYTTYEGFGGGHIGSDPIHDDEDHSDEANHQSWDADTVWQTAQTENPVTSNAFSETTESAADNREVGGRVKRNMNVVAFYLSIMALTSAIKVNALNPFLLIPSFFFIFATLICIKIGKAHPFTALFCIMATIVNVINLLQFLH